MSSIKVTKSIITEEIQLYSILIKDIYDNIKELESTFTEELKQFYMDKCLNIIVANNRKIGEDIGFNITDAYTVRSDILSDEVDVETLWIVLCWNSFIKEHELSFNKQLISISRPKIKSVSEIIETMVNESHSLLNDKKYTECIELLKEGFKYKHHRFFKIIVYNISCAYALLKDDENTFSYLNMAIESGYNDWKNAESDPDFKEYYENKTFIDLVAKMRET